MAKRTTACQFEIMLDYFKKYPQLLSGKVDSIFSKDTKDKRWKDLTLALNAEGNGPAKSLAAWRKTLKDWKCYVRKKARRIALDNKQTRGSKEELSLTERKLLAAIGEVPPLVENSVAEPQIFTSVDLDVSIDDDDDSQDDRHDYFGNRKAVKRKINSIAAEVSGKLIRSQNETNKIRRRMVELAERKVALLDHQIALLERRTAAVERKAIAKKYLVLLKEKKLRRQWKDQMHVLRMNRLKYL